MALKEKALKRLAEKLNAAGIPWVLSGEYAMVLRGMDVAWHGFELMTDADHADAADKVLTRLGMRHEEENAVCRSISYHFDGADILLLCGPLVEITSDMNATVLGAAVPLLERNAQAEWLRKTGKASLADML